MHVLRRGSVPAGVVERWINRISASAAARPDAADHDPFLVGGNAQAFLRALYLQLALGTEPTVALVLSQVVLSFGIPFALIPLVWLTRRKDVMGTLANRPLTTGLAVLATLLVVVLNAVLLSQLA